MLIRPETSTKASEETICFRGDPKAMSIKFEDFRSWLGQIDRIVICDRKTVRRPSNALPANSNGFNDFGPSGIIIAEVGRAIHAPIVCARAVGNNLLETSV